MPTRGEVLDRLRRGGAQVPATALGMILDVFGYAGAIRMTSERAYFAWSESAGQRRAS